MRIMSGLREKWFECWDLVVTVACVRVFDNAVPTKGNDLAVSYAVCSTGYGTVQCAKNVQYCTSAKISYDFKAWPAGPVSRYFDFPARPYGASTRDELAESEAPR